MTVTGPQDFYFTFEQPTVITFRTYAMQYGIDSMLWFYDDQDNLLAWNDDYFGLDSYLQYEVQPGITYRLRTGVCCWNTEAWYGSSYTVESNQELVTEPEPTTTTTTTTTTIVEETTTTTIEETTTTVEETTTTVEETTTTTEPETTTTAPEETWPPTTESTTTTTTTTTTVPETTVPATTQAPPTQTSTPSLPPSTPPATEPETVPPTTPSTSPEPVVTPPVTVTDSVAPVSSVDVPPVGTEPPVTQPPVTEPPVTEPPVEEITSPEDLQQLIESTDLESASDSELVSILSSPAFSKIDSDSANEIIDNIEFGELSDAETAQVVEALNTASDDVKQHFENQINVYSGQFDAYVPSGSTVTVAQRRVLVAVAAATSIAVPTASRRRSQ